MRSSSHFGAFALCTQAGLAEVTAAVPLTDIELERQDNMNRNRAMLQVGHEVTLLVLLF